MSIDGPGVLLNIGVGELDPLEFTEKNFPVGSFVMGGSGKLIRVENWTMTVPVVDGQASGEQIPTALVTLWGDEWYKNNDGPPSDGGKSTTLKQSSFASPAGKGWPIKFPLRAVEPESEKDEPTDVVVPDLFSSDENSGTETKLGQVEVPDAFVVDAGVEKTGETTPEPRTLPVGCTPKKSGLHPSARSKVGRLYNHVLEAGGVVRMDDVLKWAKENKLEKNVTSEGDIAKLVEELAYDDWDITIINEGYENALVSIGGVVSSGPAPSKLDNLVAEAQQKAIELYQMGIESVTIAVSVKPGLDFIVTEGDA